MNEYKNETLFEYLFDDRVSAEKTDDRVDKTNNGIDGGDPYVIMLEESDVLGDNVVDNTADNDTNNGESSGGFATDHNTKIDSGNSVRINMTLARMKEVRQHISQNEDYQAALRAEYTTLRVRLPAAIFTVGSSEYGRVVAEPKYAPRNTRAAVAGPFAPASTAVVDFTTKVFVYVLIMREK